VLESVQVWHSRPQLPVSASKGHGASDRQHKRTSRGSLSLLVSTYRSIHALSCNAGVRSGSDATSAVNAQAMQTAAPLPFSTASGWVHTMLLLWQQLTS
jgi:hypothetical protein